MSTSLMRISMREICEREGFSQTVVVNLVELDIARPVAGTTVEDWLFDTTDVHWIKTAVRLHRDLELDWIATGMLVDLLRQREQLRRENRRLRQQLERFISG
jgi:chaperone modulatory protein CbpM